MSTAAAAAAAAAAAGGATPPLRNPASEVGASPAPATVHAHNAHIKMHACSTITLSPLTALGGSAEEGSRDRRSDSGLLNNGSRGDGDSQLTGGLLVASVSECDSSAFGEDHWLAGRADDDSEEREDSDDSGDDSDDGEDGSGDAAERRPSGVYEERLKRPRSAASMQYTALADTVASDASLGGTPTQSNIIQRMTIVSFSTSGGVPFKVSRSTSTVENCGN